MNSGDSIVQVHAVSGPRGAFRRRAARIVIHLVLAALSTLASGARTAIAEANECSRVIVLPGATSAEGIAAGNGSTFYAGDLLTGDIFRGDLRSCSAERFIEAPGGRMAFGLKADVRHGLLFVAGGFTGQAYVYDLETGAEVATFQLGAVINDVVVRDARAKFLPFAIINPGENDIAAR